MGAIKREGLSRQILWTLAAIAVLAFIVRLLIGLQTSMDADEASESLAALHILRGQLLLMETNAHYLGALDSYVLAPFIAVFGTTLLAVRLCFSVVGVAYAAAMYGLGNSLFNDRRKGLIVAAISAVFPLFATSFGIRARSYGVLLLIEAVILLLTVRIAWARQPAKPREWALLGIGAGVALWHDLLLVVFLGICGLLLVGRAQVIGWARLRRGLIVAMIGALIGFSPWIAYNTFNRLGSLRHLYTPLTTYSVPTLTAARQVLSAALPIFIGARVNFCGPQTIPSWLVDAFLGLLALVVLWLRRSSVSAGLHGQFSELEPADWILLIAPLALATVTVHFFNSLSCEPRYLMPLAVPLTVAVTLVIAASGLIRVLGLAALAGCLVVSLATVRTTVDVQHNLVVVPGAPQVKLDLGTAAAAIEREHPTTVWADYWLARPIEYFSADRFVVGEYGGYVGFPDIQTAALADGHPSWLFIDGDPEISAFESECGHRGITYRRSSPIAGLVYFDQLSGKITPADLGLPTQTVRQSA